MKPLNTHNSFKKILIAHRSEVALRVQITCKALGIKTVAIYTKEDATLSFVSQADEAYKLSRSGLAGYLNQQEIIDIALACQADAIHPGYGFLAENGIFAQKVVDSGMVWIGPDPSVITLMGDKIKARQLVETLGVPTIPGFYVTHDNLDTVASQMQQQSLYPVLIKNPLSGGGKAMRSVARHEDFIPTWEKLVIESLRMGLDASILLIEKHLDQTRHIEIQVAGDGERAVHFYERECSVQRRFQKVIEEAPCNFVSQATLEKMYACAVTITQAVGYKTVGTVEFILMPDESFYFLEMNTRLQVEHAITELTTGIDLVALQIQVAAGGKLGSQDAINRRGHAIECRIYAEDPYQNFMPSTGEIIGLHLPKNIFIRHEHDLFKGMVISSFYDPMLSKLVIFHNTREGATRLMIEALKNYHIIGIKTNIGFLQAILLSQKFIAGEITTQLLGDTMYMQQLLHEKQQTQDLEVIAEIAFELFDGLPVDQSVVQQQSTISLWKSRQWT